MTCTAAVLLRPLAILWLAALPLGAATTAGGPLFTVNSLNLSPSAVGPLLAVDGQGNGYQVATVTDQSGRVWVRASETNPLGAVVATFEFGGTGIDAPSAITVDAQGRVVIAGSTTSTDFPVTTALVPATRLGAAFVVTLSAGLTGITASTLIGGSEYAPSYHGSGTGANAVATDPAGNVYLAGFTAALDFPVTAGAYQTTPPGYDTFGAATYGFVAEISANLSKILFATYFGSNTVICSGSNCIGAWGSTAFSALAVESSGAAIASGSVWVSVSPPITGNTTVAFAPGGGSVLWNRSIEPTISQQANALALDEAGNVVVAGTAVGGAPATAGAVQSCPGGSGGFVAKLAGSTGMTQFLTSFGCDSGSNGASSSVNSVAIDASGAIWITGTADPSALPVVPASPISGPSYVATLAPDGSSVQALVNAGAGIFGEALALTPSGSPVVLGGSGLLMLSTAASGPSLLGVANAAGGPATGLIAPAEFVSFYGTGLGPATPLTAEVVQFVVQPTLGGYQLQIGGVPAPLLYIGPNQINAVVPSEAAGMDSVPVALVTPSGMFALGNLYMRPSQPQIFLNPTSGYAAAVNQDGQLNSASAPAHAGEVVSIWATGAGAPGNILFPVDGMIVPGPGGTLSHPALPVSILSNGDSLEVDYAGDSPGEVFGLLQVNFRPPQSLPAGADSLAISLQVGPAISAPVSIYVAP